MASPTFLADDRLNQFNDQDEMWGPLLFLRPQRHQRLTVPRVMALAGLLGGFYGMLGNVVLALLARGSGQGRPSALAMPLILSGMYFICAQLSIVGAWNRRARQLARQLKWAEQTRPQVAPSPSVQQGPAEG